METPNLNKNRLLRELLESIQQLPYRDKTRLDAFRTQADIAIRNIFGDKSDYRHELQRIRFTPASFYSTEEDYKKSWNNGIDRTLQFLNTMLEEISLKKSSPEASSFPTNGKIQSEEENGARLPPLPPAQKKQKEEMSDTQEIREEDIEEEAMKEIASILLPKDQDTPEEKSEKTIATPMENPPLTPTPSQDDFHFKIRSEIFIVHGHDNLMRDAVIFTLQKLGLGYVVSQEGTNKAKTLIQKLTDHPGVTFAAILLSGDDLARPKDLSEESSRLRARQNVIFELGFLIGKLGRSNVFVLYQEDKNFEIPTNYFDVLYTPYDKSGRWQFDLARALKACGFAVDANRLL